MENEENKSKWDDLARELGASEPPAAQPPARPAAPQPSRGADAKRLARSKTSAAPPATPPKSTAKDWDNLAADLGVGPSAAPRAAKPKTETEKTRMSDDESPSITRAADVSRAVPESTAPATTARESSPDAAAEARPATGGGVSLWHKIFGSPEQQSQRIVEAGRPADAARSPDESRRREERPTGPRGTPPASRPDPAADDAEDSGEAAPWRDAVAEPPLEETGEGPGERLLDDKEQKPRRGRRRRRGRGRKGEGAAATDAEPTSRSQRTTSPRRSEQRPSRPSVPADRKIDDDDDDDDVEAFDLGLDEDGGDESDTDEGSATGATSRGTSPRHRNIPSWEEAMGLIVDANLQSRSERRRTSPPKTGRSGARGRSRGRRNKDA